MELRQCGRTNLRLSAIGLGCWAFGGGDYWGKQSQEDVNRVVRRAVELGINYFDNAELYNDGQSERSLGEAIRGLDRDKLVLGSKIAPANTEPATLVQHCEASLSRLGVESIDLYMVHWPILPQSADENCPSAPAAFETLIKLQRQGKVRFIGVSNFGMEVLDEARASGAQIAVNQLPYSLLSRAIEAEILPYCREAGVGVIGYMALMQGILSGAFSSLDDVPSQRRRTRHFSPAASGGMSRHGEAGAEAETKGALAAIRAIAAEHGMTMPHVAVGWAMATPGMTSVLVGARNERQLEANLLAAERPLPIEVIEKLNRATEPLKQALGPSFDYWENSSKDRTRPLIVPLVTVPLICTTRAQT
jgi:aryl-alcohol dehydrogenase-like predicted oxidoreductase